MSGHRDVLDDMIDELRRRQATAAWVLSDNESRLDDITRDALEFVGWYAIRRGSDQATDVPPQVVELIRAGREFRAGGRSGGESLGKEDRARLAVIGLVTLAGAQHPPAEERL